MAEPIKIGIGGPVGAGKTQLCVIFSSGATQVIATQP